MRGEVERSGIHVRQPIHLCQEAGRGLSWILRGSVPAGKRSGTQVSDTVEPIPHAPDKYLTAPDTAVVTVAGSIEAGRNYTFIERSSFRQYRRHVRTVMLHSNGSRRLEFRTVNSRVILRVTIVNQEHLA